MTKDFEKRCKDAIGMIVRFGGIDGSHHKNWVLDQTVRILCGCEDGKPNKEYEDLVRDAKAGEDGPDTYDWDEGIAP